jgi:hypothetical protein
MILSTTKTLSFWATGDIINAQWQLLATGGCRQFIVTRWSAKRGSAGFFVGQPNDP